MFGDEFLKLFLPMITLPRVRGALSRGLLAALVLSSSVGTLLRAGEIVGVVVASDSKSVLAGASVIVVENGKSAVTDSRWRSRSTSA